MKNLKILATYILVGLIISICFFGLGYYGAGAFERMNAKPANSMTAAEFIAELNQVQSKYSDKITVLGNRLSDYNERKYSPVTIAAGNSDEIKALRQQLADMEIQVKDLISSMSMTVINIDSSKTMLVHDTITPAKYQFVDTTGHLKLQGYADVARQTLSYKYRYIAQYDIAQYRHKPHWWSKSEERIKLLSSDPNAEVSLKTFAIKQKPKRFAIGLGLGYGAVIYNGKVAFAPFVGVSAMAKILQF